MADFVADIPNPPGMPKPLAPDSPGVVDFAWDQVTGIYHIRRPDAVLDITVTQKMETLVVGGTPPSAWEKVGTEAWSGIIRRVDWTKWRRHYDGLTFEKFNHVTIRIELSHMYIGSEKANYPPLEYQWYIPTPPTWTDMDFTETREKPSSWGWVANLSINIGEFISGTIGGDASHDSTDETPPSEHPTPRYRGLAKKAPPKDESLKTMTPTFSRALLLAPAAVASAALNAEQFETLQQEDLIAASRGRSYQDFLELLDPTASRRYEGVFKEPTAPPRQGNGPGT